MRISDWCSDVCSSDLVHALDRPLIEIVGARVGEAERAVVAARDGQPGRVAAEMPFAGQIGTIARGAQDVADGDDAVVEHRVLRSEEHTSELQSLMRISYVVFRLKQ